MAVGVEHQPLKFCVVPAAYGHRVHAWLSARIDPSAILAVSGRQHSSVDLEEIAAHDRAGGPGFELKVA